MQIVPAIAAAQPLWAVRAALPSQCFFFCLQRTPHIITHRPMNRLPAQFDQLKPLFDNHRPRASTSYQKLEPTRITPPISLFPPSTSLQCPSCTHMYTCIRITHTGDCDCPRTWNPIRSSAGCNIFVLLLTSTLPVHSDLSSLRQSVCCVLYLVAGWSRFWMYKW